MIGWLKDILQTTAVATGQTATPRTPPVQIAAPPATVRAEPVEATAARVRAMPGETLAKQLALVIDLNVCVGCHACVTSCKQWNTSGSAGPLADEQPYGADPTGTFFNLSLIHI